MRLPDGKVQCGLCPWGCLLAGGQRGRCGVRENRNGRLVSLVYGRPVATHIDPIEKKPLFHVYPGSRAFSIATVGCNIDCKFCQNWDISQAKPEDNPGPFVSPDKLAAAAAAAKVKTIAYTYSEPTIFYEYMRDCARATKDRQIESVVISNGFIREEPLRELLPHLTAYKIDMKAITPSFYEDVCAGRLQPVLDTLQRIKEAGVWLEIVVLLIPTLNDSKDEIQRLAAWVVKHLGSDVPLHFTRFHPCYRLVNLPRTPPAALARARETAMAEGCHFVYTGNLPGQKGENTYCPDCGEPLVERYGLLVRENRLVDGKCPACNRAIPGVWA